MPHKLKLHGVIGDWWDRNDSGAVTEEIEGVKDGEEIEVHLNSPGGDAFDGVAIFNSLRQHDGPVTIYVDALAASAASLIAMAGDTVIMGLGAMIMVHNPWMITLGDADDHRKSAEMLDKLRDSYVSAYTSKTDKEGEELREMLDDETWMTAEEAVEHGFADEIDEAAEEEASAAALAQHDFSKFSKVPADLREKVAAWHTRRAAAMSEAPTSTHTGADEMTTTQKNKEGAQSAADSQPQAAVEDGPDIEKIKAQARREEKKRQREIKRACAAASLDSGFADKLIEEDVDVHTAHQRVFDKLRAHQEAEHEVVPNASKAAIGAGLDERDKFIDGATQALLCRANPGGEDEYAFDRSNPFNSFSLKELARKSAVLAGAKEDRLVTAMDVAGAGYNPMAYGGHSTSDFTNILENVIDKEMLRGWEENAETFQQWTRSGSLSDFKEVKRNGLNLFDGLPEVPEGGEFKHGTIGERGEAISLATYGRLFALTRQAIINDDMSAFSAVPFKMGRAAARTIGNLAYGVLTSNDNLSDGVALFNAANHDNSTSATLDSDALDSAREAMKTQSDPDDKADGGLNIRPRFLLVPAALEGTAIVLMQSQYVPGSANNDVNTVAGMADIIVDGRLDADSTTKWYLLADPNSYDTVEVAYLNGVQTPFLEQREGWTVDGTEFKVRHDAGVKALDHRAMYRGGV